MSKITDSPNPPTAKSLRTQTAIEEAFFKLLETTPINEISVSDITKAAGTNRNTFYYHYTNTAELLESVVKHMVDDLIATYPPTYETLEDCFLAAINLARENRTIIYNIYNSTSRAVFERHLWHIIDYTLDSFAANSKVLTSVKLDPKQQSVLINFFRYEFFGFVIDWINHDMPDDVLDKAHILINLMLANTQNL